MDSTRFDFSVLTFHLDLTNEADRIRCLHLLMLLLPKGNRDTVEVLFTFLKWVASFSHVDEETGNRMDLHNLATVISPNIFRSSPSKGSDTVRVESFESIRVMITLLEHQDEFYQVPEDFLPLIRDHDYFNGAMELPSKEVLKKCDAYHRSRVNGRTPQGLTSPVLGASGGSPMPPSGSGGFSSGSDPRLTTQRSDPTMSSRGRQQGGGNGGTADSSSIPNSTMMRNGYPATPPEQRSGQVSRQQSPQPRLNHQPFSHPGSGGPLPTVQTQGFALPDHDWSGQPQQWMQPMSLPGQSTLPQGPGAFIPSASPRSYSPRSSGEYSRNFSPPNGH